MGCVDLKSLFIALLLLLFIFCVRSGSSFYGAWREYGVVKPDDPYLFVDKNEDLVLFCNLTKLDLLEDSTYLYFTRDGVRIPDSYVEVLTTRSVRLRYPIRQPEDEGHFVCWLRHERGNPRTIGSQHVLADYSPAKVSGVNCVVYNWENMTCEWDLGRDYHHPEHLHVSLVWTISLNRMSRGYGIQKDCPEGHMTPTSCTWVRYGPDSFLPGHRYIMSVEVNNTRRGFVNKSLAFRISTNSIVKPSPVVNLSKENGNTTCLSLVWYHSDLVHDKVALVQYLSQWNHSHLHKLDPIPFKRGPTRKAICGLTPFTQYTIGVAVKPLPRTDRDGYISEWQYLQNVRTQPSAPEVAPEMCVGCFTDLRCESPNCRNLIIYWKHIPWALRRSDIESYKLRYTAEKEGRVSGNIITKYPNTSELLSVDNDIDYTLHLYAVTSENKLSRRHSSLRLVAKANKPEGPASLILETDYDRDVKWTGQFDLRWSDVGQATASFLVAWCRGNIATLICDREEKNQVHWVEVSNRTTQFRVSVASTGSDRPSKYIVGVARQVWHGGHVISSGLTWAHCVYRKNKVPVSPKVDFDKVNLPGTLHVTWTYDSCDNQGANVYVNDFVIYYCVISDTSSNRCQGSEQNRTVGREARNAMLEDLQPEAYYRVSMVAVSQWGASERSNPPVYSKVTAAPQQEENAGLFIAVLVVPGIFLLIVILCCVHKCKRRIQKAQEKFVGSFNNLPPFPPDDTVKSFKDRPLPKVPAESSSEVNAAYNSGVGSAVSADNRQRGGKHKSITSETSLLGHEAEAGTEDDGRRRHKSATGSVSERSKLLVDDGVTRESAPSVSKYDSDSGAESRCSSEDHDYASVEGGSGSAEEGLDGNQGAAHNSCPAGGPRSVSRSDYVSENKAATFHAGHKQPSWKTSEHKPAPSYAPRAPLPSGQTGYIQASLVPAHTANGALSSAVSSFKPQAESQLLFRTLNPTGRSERSHQPAKLTVALEPLKPPHAAPCLSPQGAPSAGGYVGTEDPTLPRRPPGTKIRQYVQETPLTASVGPYASTSVTSFSTQLPPSPAPPPYTPLPGKDPDVSQGQEAHVVPPQPPTRPPAARGYTPHSAINGASAPAAAYSGSSTSSYNDDSLWSADSRSLEGEDEHNADHAEHIYCQPWERNGFVPVVVDNRPLSEYMMKLPQNFFDSTLHVSEGPTTEL